MSKTKNAGNVAPDALAALQEILFSKPESISPNLEKGLQNLSALPEFDLDKRIPRPVPGQAMVNRGFIAFRRNGGKITLAIACGTATIFYLPLDKFIAVIENMNDDRSANIVVQNPKVGEDGRQDGRCQILVRFNPAHSALHVVHGVIGRGIKEAKDISHIEIYYLCRRDLACFYLAAKCQVGTEEQLENLISAYDGIKGYEIPLNPLNVMV